MLSRIELTREHALLKQSRSTLPIVNANVSKSDPFYTHYCFLYAPSLPHDTWSLIEVCQNGGYKNAWCFERWDRCHWESYLDSFFLDLPLLSDWLCIFIAQDVAMRRRGRSQNESMATDTVKRKESNNEVKERHVCGQVFSWSITLIAYTTSHSTINLLRISFSKATSA